jgi:DNA/RNA endonuclease G (NUC1)
LCLIAELMYSVSGYAQPAPQSVPLFIEPMGVFRSGYAYERLDWSTTRDGDGKRKDSWKRDYRQSAEWSASNDDYSDSPLVKFHLAPCGDFAEQLYKNMTFQYSNAAPGNATLNRGPWLDLEQQIRLAVDKYTVLYVFTAPLYEPGEAIQTIGSHRVSVPTHFAKAVFQNRNGKPSMVAWVAPNVEPIEETTHEDWRVSVDDVEFRAGVDLFAWLEDDVERKLEAAK